VPAKRMRRLATKMFVFARSCYKLQPTAELACDAKSTNSAENSALAGPCGPDGPH
jgi:hypothetical protein